MDYRNMDMRLFDYSTKRNVERYKVYVESSPTLDQGPGDATSVRIPRGFRDRLTALEGRNLTAAQIEALGETIGQMLFPEQLQDVVGKNLEDVVQNDLGLRIRLKLDSFALADLPWEYAFVPSLKPGFLALNGRISLVRYEQISGPKTPLAPLGEDSLRLAALFADPKTSAVYSELHLDAEEAKIRDTLSQVTGLAADFQPQVTVDVLNKALGRRPHIVHFAGHGRFVKAMGAKPRSFEGKGYLVLLHDDKQNAEEFPVDKLVANLQGCGARLAVLGACESARRDSQNAWTGIGPALAQIGIPAVVGMQYAIRNANATTFSEHFYDNLVKGESIDWAMARGRLAIYNKPDPNERDWAVPVLYLRMRAEETDAVLFRRLAHAESIAPPRRDVGVTSSVAATHACPNCGTAVPAGLRFCEECGQRFCTQCNGGVSLAAKFCGSCGTAL